VAYQARHVLRRRLLKQRLAEAHCGGGGVFSRCRRAARRSGGASRWRTRLHSTAWATHDGAGAVGGARA
jgi:hypothetical protein